MGTRRKRRRQEALWVATTDLPQTVAHPFYRRVNALLDAHGFDAFVERHCQRFYAATRGRPSLTPGIYFRALLVGYFEGIDSERGIAWRAADSLAIRRFLGIAVDEAVPDHSTISRTRRLIDVETHRTVFTWVQQRLVASGVLKGATIGIDATTLEANAAMRSIVRRDTGEDYQAYLTGLAQASGIATPTRDDLARLDRKRKKTTSNQDWRSPVDPDAKVAKMKDGRTHLAHKVEHAVDLDTGAIVAVTVQGADTGDTTTIGDTTVAAADQIEEAQAEVDDPQAFTALVADKGYHSNGLFRLSLRLVHFDVVGEPVPAGPHHRPSQFVQPGPGRLVAAQAQHLLQRQRARPGLLTGDGPHRSKPDGERAAGVLEDRPSRDGRLAATGGTLEQPAAHRPGLLLATRRAAESVWPAQPNQVGPTRLLGPELRVELALIPGEIHHEGRTLHIGAT